MQRPVRSEYRHLCHGQASSSSPPNEPSQSGPSRCGHHASTATNEPSPRRKTPNAPHGVVTSWPWAAHGSSCVSKGSLALTSARYLAQYLLGQMAQETLVVMVPQAAHAALRARFGAGPFEFRVTPHAVFSVKGAGAVATLYTSGKLVVQAADPRAFLARWTDLDAAPAPAPTEEDPPLDVGAPVTGSDETGKGDYFGPLVVAAVRVGTADELAALVALGVADSKALTDSRALKLGHHLRGVVEYALERLDPVEYNAEWEAAGSLNPLLAGLHGKVLGKLARRGEAVVVDQFDRTGLVARAVAPLGVRLTEVPRAERHAAVAAASVLARQEFLLGLQELGERFDVVLPKGAGEPVDDAAVRILQEHGTGVLERVAKLHFKTTEKALRRAR